MTLAGVIAGWVGFEERRVERCAALFLAHQWNWSAALTHRLISFMGVALALAYLAPNHYPPWPAFHSDLLAAIAVAPIVLWALFRLGEQPKLAFFSLLLSIVPLAQVLVGQIIFPGDGWVAGLYLAGFGLTVLAGARLNSGKPNLHGSATQLAPLFAGLVVAGVVSVGLATHQWLNLQLSGLFTLDLEAGGRPYANMAQPNQLATLLLMGLVGSAYLYECRIVRGATALIAAVVLAFGLALTESRTALIAICVIWLAFLTMRRRANLRLTPLALLIPSCTFLLVTWFWSSINSFLLLSPGISLAERMGQNLRLTIWSALLDAVWRSPWFGYGWNQIPVAQQATALDHPATRYLFDSSHNLFLDLALWNGLPIALLVAAGLAIWFWKRIAECRDPSSWCLLLVVSLVFCHAMVEYPLAYAYFLLPVGFIMGALDRTTSSDGAHEGAKVRLPSVILLGAGLTALTISTMVVAEYLPLESQWREIRFEQARIGNAQMSPAPNTRVLTQLREHAKFRQTPVTSQMTQEQLDWMGQVAQRFGWAGNLFKYAQALAINGRPGEASIVLAKLCKIQSPLLCRRAVEEWRLLASGKFPEMEKVALPLLPDLPGQGGRIEAPPLHGSPAP